MNDTFGIDQNGLWEPDGCNPVGVYDHVAMIPKVARGRTTLG